MHDFQLPALLRYVCPFFIPSLLCWHYRQMWSTQQYSYCVTATCTQTADTVSIWQVDRSKNCLHMQWIPGEATRTRIQIQTTPFFPSQTGTTIVQCFASCLSSEYSTIRWWLLTCTGPGNNLLTWYVYPRREECSLYFCSLLMLLSLAVSHPTSAETTVW